MEPENTMTTEQATPEAGFDDTAFFAGFDAEDDFPADSSDTDDANVPTEETPPEATPEGGETKEDVPAEGAPAEEAADPPPEDPPAEPAPAEETANGNGVLTYSSAISTTAWDKGFYRIRAYATKSGSIDSVVTDKRIVIA